MEHQHHHSHPHKHHGGSQGKRLMLVTLLNLSISVVQIAGGIVSNSLSLLSDALHNLGDSSALFIAFVAHKISHKKPDIRRTFGYKRVEILAALFNGMVLIAICLFLFYEAYQRFLSPEPVHGSTMLVVAIFGLIANLVSMLLLQKDKTENLNIKTAYLHLLGDTFSSVAVIAGGIIMWKSGIYWIDPVISVLVGIYIIYHTWGVIKETADILMQASPSGIDINHIKHHLEQVEDVDNIHHIHLWRLDDSQIHFEAHINLKNNIQVKEMMGVKQTIEHLLKNQFHIAHTTLQFGYGCCNEFHHTIGGSDE
jgi:cobalt-zinc-cadmium efflux system protein